MYLLFLEDVIRWFSYGWWLWLFIVGWWYYSWAKDHLGFSPLLTLAVGGILVYFLVIEHPLIGSLSMLSWVFLTSGILFLLPMVTAFFNTVFNPIPKLEQRVKPRPLQPSY